MFQSQSWKIMIWSLPRAEKGQKIIVHRLRIATDTPIFVPINREQKPWIGIACLGLFIIVLSIYDYGKPTIEYYPYRYQGRFITAFKQTTDPHTEIIITHYGWFRKNNRVRYYKFKGFLNRKEIKVKVDSIIKTKE